MRGKWFLQSYGNGEEGSSRGGLGGEGRSWGGWKEKGEGLGACGRGGGPTGEYTFLLVSASVYLFMVCYAESSALATGGLGSWDLVRLDVCLYRPCYYYYGKNQRDACCCLSASGVGYGSFL